MSFPQSIVKPLRPRGAQWHGPFEPGAAVSNAGYPAELWFNREHSLSVISAVEVASDKDGIERGPEYHISIARQTRSGPARCESTVAFWVLDQFGLDGSEEDNHVPHGAVRNFWRTVAEPMIGLECACKADEPAVVEDKGDFVWRP